MTASTPGSASASASDVHACATPSRSARRAVRSAIAADEREHVEARRRAARARARGAEPGADDDRAGRHRLVALVGIDDLAQRLAAREAPEVVDEDVERGAPAGSGVYHEMCAVSRTFGCE